MKRTATVLLCAAAYALPTPAWADDEETTVAETTVACGQVITASIKLANDLRACPGIGLEVGASKITIDLNGHTIAGAVGSTNGIDNTSSGMSPRGHSDVKIKDGTVMGFGSNGIRLAIGADRNCVEGIVAIRNNRGLEVESVDSVRVSKNFSLDNANSGIRLISVINGLIERNVALNNDVGIFLQGKSTGNLLHGNRAMHNIASGIVVNANVTATRIEDNTTNINGIDGIDVRATDTATVIKDNRAYRNVQLGIRAATGVTDGGGNRTSGNGDPVQCSSNIDCTSL